MAEGVSQCHSAALPALTALSAWGNHHQGTHAFPQHGHVALAALPAKDSHHQGAHVMCARGGGLERSLIITGQRGCLSHSTAQHSTRMCTCTQFVFRCRKRMQCTHCKHMKEQQFAARDDLHMIV
eukprot:1159963-Pelagomonas_calceolata.AAC.2